MKSLLILPLAQLLFMATAPAQTTSATTQERLNASENITGENRSGLAPQQAPSGFIFLNGNVYVVSGGRATPLTREMSFRVTPLGFVGFNGAPQNIPSGSMLSMDGQLMAAPNNLVDVTGNAIVLPPFNQQASGLNGAGNMTNNQGNNNGASQSQTNPQQQNGTNAQNGVINQNGTNMQNGANNQNGTNTNGTNPNSANQNGVRNGSNGQPATGTTPINPPANGGTPTPPSANGATPSTPSANGATPKTPNTGGGTGTGTSGGSGGTSGGSSGGTSGGAGGAKGK